MPPSAERGAGPAPCAGPDGPARGRRRARVAPWLLPAALALVAVLLLWRSRDSLLQPWLSAAVASPETQVREALARQDRAVLEDVDRGGGRAELAALRFADVAVQVDGERAQVIAVVEARGAVAWGAGRAELAYVGREAFTMARCSGARWCAEGVQLPELRGVLAALRRRADAAGPAVHVRAWQIRVERDRASAGEDYDVVLPGRTERRRSLTDVRREGGSWALVESGADLR